MQIIQLGTGKILWKYESMASLSRADLSGADLSRANLSWANLVGANLSWANLLGAYLVGASGILPLSVCDPRGYVSYAVSGPDGWMVKAGCRWFTLPEALEHWGRPDGPIALRYLRALQWLATQPLSIADSLD